VANVCPKCGNDLDNKYYCKTCDITVDMYDKIKKLSKLFYNQGLQKAKVRDLSGAISLLQRSVKFNKNNIDARNLLGLVYFELGETVAALGQWVISKNIKPEENIAVEYLDQVQKNQEHLNRLNSAIKNYNQSLKHIKQNSRDLAIIQLKKALNLNTKFVKAYCLLALCYIKEGDNSKAKKTLLNVLSIDNSNYIGRKYYDELREDDEVSGTEADINKKQTKVVKTRKSQPFYQFTSYKSQLLVLFFGLILGLAVGMFLLKPMQISNKNEKITSLTDKVEDLNKDKDKLSTQLDSLKQEKTSLETKLSKAEEMSKGSDYLTNLIKAIMQFEEGKMVEAANTLLLVDSKLITDPTIKALYDKRKAEILPKLAIDLYNEGYRLYSTGKYDESIAKLEQSYKFSATENISDEVVYFIARDYQKKNNPQKAIEYFEKLMSQYPNATKINDAKYYLGQLKKQQQQNQ
jgi:tetratricopeptide (TPR) repeat protein